MSTLRHSSLLALALVALACASKGSTDAHVTATVDPQLRNLSNARIVAIGGGHVFSAPILASGHFSVAVPSGSRYRLVVANTTGTGELRTIGHLAITPKSGSVALGALRPAGTAPAPSNAMIHTQSENETEGASGGGKDDGEDDGKEANDDENEKDGDRLCDSGDDVDLEAEHGDDAKAGDDEGETTHKPCDKKDTKHTGLDDDDSSGGGGSSSGGSSPAGAPAAPPPPT
jgi:hypothetical protein